MFRGSAKLLVLVASPASRALLQIKVKDAYGATGLQLKGTEVVAGGLAPSELLVVSGTTLRRIMDHFKHFGVKVMPVAKARSTKQTSACQSPPGKTLLEVLSRSPSSVCALRASPCLQKSLVPTSAY